MRYGSLFRLKPSNIQLFSQSHVYAGRTCEFGEYVFEEKVAGGALAGAEVGLVMTGQVVGEGILRGRRSELVRRCSQNHLAAHMAAALHGKLFRKM